MRSLSPFLLLSLVSTCETVAVFRCEDASSHVSFTQLGCSAGQAGETIVTDNPLSGGRSATSIAETKVKKASIGRKSIPLTVVGERENRYGRRLDEKERRKAVVEQRITAGVIRSGVERALGKPGRVSGNNVEVRYQYKTDKRRRVRSMSFDQEEYVKGKGRYRAEQADPRS